MGGEVLEVLVVLAPGAEEMETVISVDVLRRAGLTVRLAGLNGEETVTCSREVRLAPDSSLASLTSTGCEYDCILLPGGGPGAAALCSSTELGSLLRQQDKAGRLIAAICAAPTALASHQVGLGKAVTSYPAPAFREKLSGTFQYREEDVVVDGNIVTSRGPGTTFKFALEIVKILLGEEKMKEVAAAMLVPC